MSLGAPKGITLASARARWDELEAELQRFNDPDMRESYTPEELDSLIASCAAAKKLVNRLEKAALRNLKRQ